MLVRVIDYVGNLGGGVRFTIEMLRAFKKIKAEALFEIISHGHSFQRYDELIRDVGLRIKVRDIKPQKGWRNPKPIKPLKLPGGRILKQLLAPLTKWHFEVPPSVIHECDLAWLPWIHWHRIPHEVSKSVVGSFHDAIIFQFKGILPDRRVSNERQTIEGWIDSEAIITASSITTAGTLVKLFGTSHQRFKVIPLSGKHAEVDTEASLPDEWTWAQDRYLIYPANTFPHKNHELLLEGIAKWGKKYPLVLTGDGSKLRDRERGGVIRKRARELGLEIGKSLIALGYISNEYYYSLLKQSWALIMCSLGEGGGSFPVWEAMLHGVPVICSEIPVMREFLGRIGGDVLWFDPLDADDLARQLNNLEKDYSKYKSQAIKQRNEISHRSWVDVAKEYWNLFLSQ